MKRWDTKLISCKSKKGKIKKRKNWSQVESLWNNRKILIALITDQCKWILLKGNDPNILIKRVLRKEVLVVMRSEEEVYLQGKRKFEIHSNGIE